MNKPASFPRIVELVAMGDGLGVVLPPELVQRLGLTPGDHLDVADTPDGFAAVRGGQIAGGQMAVLREVMVRRRKALAALAK